MRGEGRGIARGKGSDGWGGGARKWEGRAEGRGSEKR